MYPLDTDHISLMERKNSLESQRLHFRLASLKSGEYATTIITFEEQMRGWMALLSQSRTLDKQVEYYGWLKNAVDRYCKIGVLPFDKRAALEFEQLQKQRIRIGTMDLKIAAIAIANNATLLSKNLRDFQKVPGLKVEDWAL